MPREKQQVRLPELPVFKRFSLVLRQEFASAEEVLSALERSTLKIQKLIERAADEKRRERAAGAKEPVVEDLPEAPVTAPAADTAPEEEEQSIEEAPEAEEAAPQPEPAKPPTKLSRRQLRQQREQEEAEAERREREWRRRQEQERLEEEEKRMAAALADEASIEDWKLPIDEDEPVLEADKTFPAWNGGDEDGALQEASHRVRPKGSPSSSTRPKSSKTGTRKAKPPAPQIVRVGARGKPLKSSAPKKPAQKNR